MNDLAERLKHEVDLREYLAGHGVRVRGKEAHCPFHADHKASMSVDCKDGAWLWHCHAGCGSGSIIDFEMKANGSTVGEAIQRLAEKYGFSAVGEKTDAGSAKERPDRPACAGGNPPTCRAAAQARHADRGLFVEVITSLWRQTRERFLSGEEKRALEFLAAKGISFETAKRCNVAAATWTKEQYREIHRGCSRKYGVAFRSLGLGGLFLFAKHGLPFLIYPFWPGFDVPDPNGDPKTAPPLHYIKFRPCVSRSDAERLEIQPHLKPKGHSSSAIWLPVGLPPERGELARVDRGNRGPTGLPPQQPVLYLVEGETDCMTAVQAGAVAGALPGAGTKLPKSLLSELSERHIQVHVLGDLDDAGEKMLCECTRELLDAGVKTVPLRLPKEVSGMTGWGKDLNDFWRAVPENGREKILDLLQPVDCKSLVPSDTQAQETPGGKPVVTVTGSQLREMICKSWEVLRQVNDPPRLFRHGDELTYLGTAPEEAEKPDRDRRPAILHVDEAVMHGMLIRHLDWVRATENGTKPAKPPVDVARDMVNFRPLPDWLPPLDSIITAPSYGPDLKLIFPGYNPGLRLAYLPSVVISPPENPSDDDMKEAVGKIGYLLTDFPFKDESDRANAVGLLLLSLLRPAILESVPLVVITATLQRAGKGALASIFEILMTGTNASAVQYSKLEEEFRKALLPYISGGQPAIRLDNVDDGSELSSPHLASAITEGWYCDRVLQRSEVLGVPVKSVFLATGNNITVSKDLLFRTLWIRLTPDTDEPDKRHFVIDGIEQHVRENRAEYLTALATMVEYWKARGSKPWKARRWNAFNQFVGIIGGVLEACGIRGFLSNTDDQRAAGSPGEEEWRHVLQQWMEVTDVPQPASWLLENVFDKCEPLTYIRINGKDDKGRARSLSRLLGRHIGAPRTLHGGIVVAIEKTYASKDKRDLFALHVLRDRRGNQTPESLSPQLTRPVSPCGIRPGGYSGLSGLNFNYPRVEKVNEEDHSTRDSINSKDAELYPLYPPSPPTLTGQQVTGRVNGGYTGMTASFSPPEPSNPPDGNRPSPSLPVSIKDWPENWRFMFEERAAIMEYDGNLPKEKAEALAETNVRKEFEDCAKDETTGLLYETTCPP